MRRLHSRLDRLEARRPALPPDATTPYVHPLSPPSTAWWAELDTLIDASPYRDALMASLAGNEGEESVCS